MTFRLPRNEAPPRSACCRAAKTALLAAHEAALGIEQGDVAVADDVLGQPPPRLVAGHDLEAQAPLPARAQQGRMIGVVVVHDGHHAR